MIAFNALRAPGHQYITLVISRLHLDDAQPAKEESPQMATSNVNRDTAEVGGPSGSLFENMKFWFSLTVPQRAWLKQQVERNGGQVVSQEQDAHVLLVDHKRKDVAPGTFSYQFVERSIRYGRLESLEDHRAGPSIYSPRHVGSTARRPRTHRIPFSVKDDQILYDWVKPFEEQGGAYKGNEIYKQLENEHPQHTFHSWRDRYLQKVRHHPRPVGREDIPEDENAIRSSVKSSRQPSNAENEVTRADSLRSSRKQDAGFTEDDKLALLKQAKHILRVDPGKENEAWTEYAENTEHTAEEWKSYFDRVVRPQYAVEHTKRKAFRTSHAASPQSHKMSFMASPMIPTDDAHSHRVHNKTSSGQQKVGIGREDLRNSRQSISQENSVAPSIELESIEDRKRKAADDLPRETPSTDGQNMARESDRSTRSCRRSPANQKTPREREAVRQRDTLGADGENQLSPDTDHPSRSTSENDQFETAPQFQDTQDVFTAPTQTIDHWNDFMERKLQQPIPELELETTRKMDKWIDERVRSGKAASEEQVIEALQCTSMDPHLADKVIEHLVAGKGIPTYMRGVWTPEDDTCLEGTDARDIERMNQKHGKDLVDARFEYLEFQREIDLDNELENKAEP